MPTMVAMDRPSSILGQRVVGCLREHPHDDSPASLARRLDLAAPDAIDAALLALEHDGLVFHAGAHWQLTYAGWAAARDTVVSAQPTSG
jgi:hypothetical protein